MKYGPPECLEDLELMFEGVTVDGSSSCIPGENAYDGAFGDRGDYEGYEEEDYGTPMTTGSLKRTSSTNTTVTNVGDYAGYSYSRSKGNVRGI